MKTRKIDRRPTQISGECRTVEGSIADVTVCDLTAGGCRFRDTGQGFIIGAPVRLTIGGTGPHGCYVRWRNDGFVGVAFVNDLPPELVELLHGGVTVSNGSAPSAQMEDATRAEDAAGAGNSAATDPARDPPSKKGALPLRHIC